MTTVDIAWLKTPRARELAKVLTAYHAAKGRPPSGAHRVYAKDMRALEAAAKKLTKSKNVELTFNGIPLKPYEEVPTDKHA